MIAFLVLALCIVLAGVFSPIRWLAVAGTLLLLAAYVLALGDNRRRRQQRYVNRRWS